MSTVLGRTVFCAMLLTPSSAGCARPLDTAIVAANASADVADRAETTLSGLYERDQRQCLELDVEAAKPCVDATRARYRPVWKSYDIFRASWLSAAAVIGAAQAAEASGTGVDLVKLAAALQSMMAAQQAFAAALSSAKEAP